MMATATATNGFNFFPAHGTLPTGDQVVPEMWWKSQAALIQIQFGNEYRDAQPLYGTWAESVRMFGEYRVVFIIDAMRQVAWKFV